MNLLEQYKDFLEAAKLASESNEIKTTSLVGTVMSYSDSLKNAAYLSMIEGNHLLKIKNVKDILKILITSSLIFNYRLDKIELINELEFLESDSFDIDFLFEKAGLLSNEMFKNIQEEQEGLSNDLILFFIKYYTYFNPIITEENQS